MGIYSKKRKNSGFKFVIYSIFLLSITLILGYYFFYPNNLNTTLDENPLETIIEVSDRAEAINKTNESNDSRGEIEIDLSNYLEVSDLDRKIKDFIQNNPDFIIDVLRKYQDEQSKVEQDKIS